MSRRVALCLALTALVAAPAAAQEVKPRILLIFDTSGSMGFDIDNGLSTGGDNSLEYPGNGGTSRLYVAKEVIRSIVETTAEVEFALMRYPQVEEEDGNNGMGREGFTDYRGLAENPLNYEGLCSGDVFLRPEFPFRASALAEGFEADNENDILGWMDHREDYPDNRELRAEGPTPIAETLRLASLYFTDILSRDRALRCRRNYVVLLTDGQESCVLANPEVRVNEQVTALRTMRVEGVDVDIRTFVIAFAVDDMVAEILDRVAVAGGTAMEGGAFRADDAAALRRAFVSILAEAIPGEACNGEDDDCDGRIDEGALNACGSCGEVPPEQCNDADDDCDGITDEGVRNRCGRCGPEPVEVCNTIDDDCDGLIDEGVANPGGNCAPPTAEVCNGIDDDFDGRIDNRPDTDEPITRSCSTDTGACEVGDEYCVMGRWGGCDGVLPTEEECNGLDDDCDGVTDEITRPCGDAVDIGDVGQCRVGRQACAFIDCIDAPGACDGDGWSVVCDDARGPTEEICDGIDNDCDGSADEGLFNACGECGVDPPEACNGLDDNCDGRVDEDADCPRGYLCYFGECVQRCVNGECAGDTFCVNVWPANSFCHPDPCVGLDCGRFACSPEEGGCYDACAGADCGPGQVCDPRQGACVAEDCHATGCAEGQRCTAGACEADPCAAVQCRAGEFCREGLCVGVCRNVRCAPGERCLDGDCVPDDCGGRCLRGERCDPSDGLCYADPCRDVVCPRGQGCVDGECRGDAPCVHVECPGGTVCVDGSCTDHTPAVEPTLGRVVPDAGPDFGPFPDYDVLDGGPIGAEPYIPPADFGPGPGADEGGDGGCDCRADGGGPAGWLALSLLLLGVRRRR